MKETKDEQQRDYNILLDEKENLQDKNEKLVLNSKPGPIVWVGDINIQLHEEIKLDALKKSTNYIDKFFWPKLWFKEIKDEIIFKANHTE